MKFLKRNYILLLIFIVTTLSVFLLWPAEKDSYGHCSANDLCSGRFSTQIGGGVFYVSHLQSEKTSFADEPLIQQIYMQDEQAYYLFSPVIAAGISLLIGVGVLVIATIVRRVIRRRKQFGKDLSEPLEQ